VKKKGREKRRKKEKKRKKRSQKRNKEKRKKEGEGPKKKPPNWHPTPTSRLVSSCHHHSHPSPPAIVRNLP